VELLGSLFVTSYFIGIPQLLYIYFAKHIQLGISPQTYYFICFLIMLSIFITIIGTIGAFKDIARDSKTYGSPFDCHLLGEL
jgi:hypothetical protein